jgi:16S rRNA (uracil1498-N3)-methyltransferase
MAQQMTRRRFFAPPGAFDSQQPRVTLTADEARHLRDVLRLRRDDIVHVFDGRGKEFRCVVFQVTRTNVELEVLEPSDPASAESPLDLTLVLALLKGEKFDLVVQKATELGVNRIVPMLTKHADIHLRDASDSQKRVERWQRIALEAAKQSGRAVVPDVGQPIPFSELIQRGDGMCRLMFSERGGISMAEHPQSHPHAQIVSLIGSEGGWSDEEIEQARDAGWEIITLGGRILRAETAAIATTALLQHRYGDVK